VKEKIGKREGKVGKENGENGKAELRLKMGAISGQRKNKTGETGEAQECKLTVFKNKRKRDEFWGGGKSGGERSRGKRFPKKRKEDGEGRGRGKNTKMTSVYREKKKDSNSNIEPLKKKNTHTGPNSPLTVKIRDGKTHS